MFTYPCFRPTFYRIYKKKSSEGYQSIPYAVALFSALLLLYYGSLKIDGILLVTINSFGCAIELLYLMIYVVYAPKKAKVYTLSNPSLNFFHSESELRLRVIYA